MKPDSTHDSRQRYGELSVMHARSLHLNEKDRFHAIVMTVVKQDGQWGGNGLEAEWQWNGSGMAVELQ